MEKMPCIIFFLEKRIQEPSKVDVQIREQFKNVSTLYEDLLSGSVKLKDGEKPQDLVNLNRSIEEYKKQTSQKSKTVKLWSAFQLCQVSIPLFAKDAKLAIYPPRCLRDVHL